MKKLLTAIAMVGFLISPCVVSAAYIIHLKDGRDFVTGQYSEEGDQIRFERYGGLIGIRKDLVREIEEVADLPDEKEAPKQKRADQAKKIKGEEQKIPLATSEEEKEQEKAVEIEMILDEKRQLMWEIEGATSAFKEARKTSNEAEKRKWWLERIRLRTRLSQLQESVKAAHGGKLPDWWQRDL